ncbi:MAG: hypothetical protein LBN19_04910 [Endomicrobium sp.]|nr:hypothetical protein [Endomicrobium sp.]
MLFPYNNKIFPTVGGQYMIGINNEISIILRTGYNRQETNSAFFSGFNAGFWCKIPQYYD